MYRHAEKLLVMHVMTLLTNKRLCHVQVQNGLSQLRVPKMSTATRLVSGQICGLVPYKNLVNN